MLMIGTTAVRAEVRVQGDAAALQVHADRSQAAEVLSALGAKLNIRVHTSIPLDRMISGTYAGSLQQVLPGVLDGYNYIVKRGSSGIEVLVVGKRGDQSVVAEPLPSPPPTKSLAAEWRK